MIILHPPGPIFIQLTHQALTNWKFLVSGNPPPKRTDEKNKIKRWHLFNAVGKSTKYNQSIRMYYYCTLIFVWSTIIVQCMKSFRIRTVLVLSYSYVFIFSYVLLSCSYVILLSADIRRRMKDWQRAAGFVFVLNTSSTTFVYVFSIRYSVPGVVSSWRTYVEEADDDEERAAARLSLMMRPQFPAVCRWRVFNAVAGLAIITAPLRLHLRKRVAVKDPRGCSFVFGF
jgi:hypothetical protein